VDAGTTYYIQIGALESWSTNVALSVQLAPDPSVNFWVSPYDPSVFDAIQFYGYASDPAGFQIVSYDWDLGDGTTSTDFSLSHTYAADGDYTVVLTVATDDGRTATTSQVVPVRTHDVAITKLSVPVTASTNQTRQITVSMSSPRATEQVQVDLYRITASGTYAVGTTTLTVPTRPANRTTNVSFSYTFTRSDAAIGKVTFRVTATVVGGRDALPGDNEAIATTRVQR
jgi:PKD repeat protein